MTNTVAPKENGDNEAENTSCELNQYLIKQTFSIKS